VDASLPYRLRLSGSNSKETPMWNKRRIAAALASLALLGGAATVAQARTDFLRIDPDSASKRSGSSADKLSVTSKPPGLSDQRGWSGTNATSGMGVTSSQSSYLRVIPYDCNYPQLQFTFRPFPSHLRIKTRRSL
jgi:hypothetical protein